MVGGNREAMRRNNWSFICHISHAFGITWNDFKHYSHS